MIKIEKIIKVEKRELLLDGLDCAHCAAKIEEKIQEIEGVTGATLNFVTKLLVFETENINKIQSIIEEIKDIVKKMEPHVVVKERDAYKTRKNSFILKGLGCANCAIKMESQIKNIEGVKSAIVDFASAKLILEWEERFDLNEIKEEVVTIIKRIESHVEVVEEEQRQIKEEIEEKNFIKEHARIIMGASFFLVATGFQFSFPIEFTLYFISYILIGGDVLLKAGKNILRGQVFDENFLMAVATIGAFAVKEFPEGVAVMLFYQVGEIFQGMAVNRSRKSIAELMDIRPDFANVKIGDMIKTLRPEEVHLGDQIVVKPGEKIPMDGKILEGASMVDTSALTGESVPREVSLGDEVLGGFINKNGLLTIEVTKEFGESTISKILDLVENASSKKSKTENFITKFAKYYTPMVVFTAMGLAIIPPLLMSGENFGSWIYRALIFLVISCPCALVVSIPLSFFGGIGGASRNGILVKGSNYLEALNNVETVVFDKTGTLTKGVFKVTKIHSKEPFTNDQLLSYAALAESYSNHPIAQSILGAYGREINKEDIKEYDEISGHGIRIVVEDKEILVGNRKLMESEEIAYDEVKDQGTAVYVSIDKKYAGCILINDEIKEDADATIKGLKNLEIKETVMLTGDLKSVGNRVGKELGIDSVYAELLPHEKVEKLEMLEKNKSKNGKLLFVGDGINDAPVLARADIGVAMGGLGSDAAIEAADVVLMTDEISKILDGIKIAKKTRKIVWQNIVFSLGVKGIVLLLGAGGMATMWEAVFADVGVAIIAIMNAMRVMRVEN